MPEGVVNNAVEDRITQGGVGETGVPIGNGYLRGDNRRDLAKMVIAPTLFGRATYSSLTWYEQKPAWKQLVAAPDPLAIKSAGFDYIYFDNLYWGDLDMAWRARLESP